MRLSCLGMISFLFVFLFVVAFVAAIHKHVLFMCTVFSNNLTIHIHIVYYSIFCVFFLMLACKSNLLCSGLEKGLCFLREKNYFLR